MKTIFLHVPLPWEPFPDYNTVPPLCLSASTDNVEIIHVDPPTVQRTTPSHNHKHWQSKLERNSTNLERWLYVTSLNLALLSTNRSFRYQILFMLNHLLTACLIFYQVWEWLVQQLGTGTLWIVRQVQQY
jgi:hypothetical protein